MSVCEREKERPRKTEIERQQWMIETYRVDEEREYSLIKKK